VRTITKNSKKWYFEVLEKIKKMRTCISNVDIIRADFGIKNDYV
jgi:hypothetical protein